MGNYIGRDVPYGQFDTQVLTPNSVLTTFNLTYKVSTAASILVVLAGAIQQPNIQYSLSNGGTQIVFTSAPTTGSSLFILYLGRELGTASGNGSAVSDGDKGDITVSGSGTTWTVDSQAITYAKLQTISASRLLGRAASTPGAAQEIVLGPSLFFNGTTLNSIPLFNDGTAASPSVYFSTDVNTGIFRPTEDNIAISTGGTERLRVKNGGQIRFTPLTADPTLNVQAGDVYYNSTTNKLRVYNGTAWVDLH